MALWRRIEEVDIPADRAWVFGIARNVIRNQWRASSRWGRLIRRAGATHVARPGEPEEIALSNDAGARAVEALRTLQTSDQEILIMSAWDDLSGPEIASILGISSNTVHQRLHRAKKRLAKAMGEGGGIAGERPVEGERR